MFSCKSLRRAVQRLNRGGTPMMTPHPFRGVQLRLMSSLPDYTELPMPALSPTMEVGTIAKWQKNEGDEIAAGDVLADVETDKAVVAFESVEEGFLAKILVEEGAPDIPVGAVVAIMVESEDDVAAFKDFKADAAAPVSAPPTPAPESAPEPAPSTPPPEPAQPPKTAAPLPPAPAEVPVVAATVEVPMSAEPEEDFGDMEVVQDEWSGWYVKQV